MNKKKLYKDMAFIINFISGTMLFIGTIIFWSEMPLGIAWLIMAFMLSLFYMAKDFGDKNHD